MSETVNEHYDTLLSNLNSDKDSIFEPCRVVDFNPKTLMATVRGIRSKAIKKNVIVLFPAMFMNTGIISFPVKHSVGLSFVGVDSEVYLLPAQFLPPVKETKNAAVSSNSSPGQFDELMSLENLEPGEMLLRSLGGAQLYIRNTGEVEMSTSKMHRLSLSELDGAMELVVERKREQVGYSEFFNGVHDPNYSDDSKEHHIFATYFEETPDWETDEVLSADVVRKIMDGKFDSGIEFDVATQKPIAKKQMVNVYHEDDSKKISSVDGSELFLDFELYGKQGPIENKQGTEPFGRFKIKLSKNGTLETESSSADQTNKVSVTHGNDFFETKISNSKNGSSASIRLTADGEIELKDGSGFHTLSSIMSRIQALEGR